MNFVVICEEVSCETINQYGASESFFDNERVVAEHAIQLAEPLGHSSASLDTIELVTESFLRYRSLPVIRQ